MTVRTLRYYEEIGLIAPEGGTDSGHRLYGPGAVHRLYKISLLRQLGPNAFREYSTTDIGGHLGRS
jgi:DNA-binding transcriptional MerR regulator